jgi:hypothetical protein
MASMAKRVPWKQSPPVKISGSAVCRVRGIGLETATGNLGLGILKQITPDEGLTNGSQEVIARNGDSSILVIGRIELVIFIKDRSALLQHDFGQFPIFRMELFDTPAVIDGDAFFSASAISSLAAVMISGVQGNTDRRSRLPIWLGGSGNIDGDIAATHQDHVAGELLSSAKIDALEEIDAGETPSASSSRNIEFPSALSTDGDIESFIALLFGDQRS